MAIGADVVGNIDGAEQVLRILRERFAPDAIGSIFQDMAEIMYSKRTGQNTDTYLMEFDMLRQQAGARMLAGSGFPDESVSTHAKRCIGQKWENLGFGQFRQHPGLSIGSA